MKKLISILVTGLFGFTILATSIPAYASSKNGKSNFGQTKKTENFKDKGSEDKDNNDENKNEDSSRPKPSKLKNLVAFINSVDTAAKTVGIRNAANGKTVNAGSAVIVILNADGAKVGTLADLKTGYKAAFWVKKGSSSYDAVVILQDLSTRQKTEPTPASGITVKFSSASANGLESATPVSIPVVLSAAANKDVKVAYTVTGTATGGGVDYTLANGELTILKGQTTASLSLAVAEDTLDELDETVIVTLSNPENATLGDTKVYTYTIKDNDQPSVSFNAAAGSSLENVATVIIPVTLSKASTHEVKVKYALTGTATGGGADYTLANGELTFAAGETSKDLSLAVVDDTTDEPDETVIVTLSEPTGSVLGATAVFTQTITDND